MFKFLKFGRKTTALTEAELDVIEALEIHGVFLNAAEIRRLLLTWSNTERQMNAEGLGGLIADSVSDFKVKFADKNLAERDSYGRVVAKHVIKDMLTKGLLKSVGRKSHGTYKLTWFGEQARQYIVVRAGLSKTITSRSELFDKA